MEAVHYYFAAVGCERRNTPTHYRWVFPHLVGFRPDPKDPDSHQVAYQQEEVEELVRGIIQRAGFPFLIYTIVPTGKFECNDPHWHQFEVVLSLPQ